MDGITYALWAGLFICLGPAHFVELPRLLLTMAANLVLNLSQPLKSSEGREYSYQSPRKPPDAGSGENSKFGSLTRRESSSNDRRRIPSEKESPQKSKADPMDSLVQNIDPSRYMLLCLSTCDSL